MKMKLNFTLLKGPSLNGIAQRQRLIIRKHGVSFGEGATVFGDVDGVMIPDPDHSEEESRFVLVGRSRLRRLLIVVSVERGERVRLISARRAGRKEKKVYEEGRQN
jgi:uncharacterized protein